MINVSKLAILKVLIVYLLSGCDLAGESEQESIWEDLHLPVENGNEVAVSTNGHVYLVAGEQGLYRLKNGKIDNGWEYLGFKSSEKGNITGVRSIDVYNKEIIISSLQEAETESGIRNVGIWKSVDNGNTWLPYDAGLQNDSHDTYWPNDIIRSPHDEKVILAGGGNIFRKTGESEWSEVYPNRDTRHNTRMDFRWNPHNNNQVWVIGNTARLGGVMGRSTDGGRTWETEYYPLSYYSFHFDATDPNIVYTRRGSVDISSNEGENLFNFDSAHVSYASKSFYRLEPHSKIGGVFFGVEGVEEQEPGFPPKIESFLYGTIDRGEHFIDLHMPDDVGVIRNLKFSEPDNSLYVLGTGVAYRLKNPMQRLE